LRLGVGHNTYLGSVCINQADISRRYLVVGQRLFTVAFALNTAGLP
jgi:hypothetical protein